MGRNSATTESGGEKLNFDIKMAREFKSREFNYIYKFLSQFLSYHFSGVNFAIKLNDKNFLFFIALFIIFLWQ